MAAGAAAAAPGAADGDGTNVVAAKDISAFAKGLEHKKNSFGGWVVRGSGSAAAEFAQAAG